MICGVEEDDDDNGGGGAAFALGRRFANATKCAFSSSVRVGSYSCEGMGTSILRNEAT